ncbi:hypothetical protein LCGC14_2150240 [marine sediment metagenome]|uniref:Uncharacterized protein n=1 Tax=marine sediment metagenome TaxID=412755 RepID=A0A0F9DVL3_9ZZZZ
MAKLSKSIRLCFKTDLKGNTLKMKSKKPVLFFMLLFLILNIFKKSYKNAGSDGLRIKFE